ncbi:tetraacyldisaccharide 4'-kinase [Paralimibaculum aggregatum]|uniref:Tetraacyldisaccharide 4'-kinase n=1 Tax=Paralimibaculum aggregatum TaxID=3036245 RepID=A0ABQ6LJF7_9RHOB|nr:tetraacyldisaccharide 4'-kinase [Limibaculum sp. NKW23]GMG81802.1 tetraacyldisaccharide 4'-kinase [Limibaculum sp. NKW23]
MRAPGFWSAPRRAPGLAARLLAPASLLWRLGGWLRALRTRPGRAPVPVICIGNLTAGGAGKTPLVLALAARLAAAGHAPAIVSRGHGGRLRGPHRVDPRADSAADVGDEPLLLAETAPTWIARDRGAGAAAAAASGAGLVLLDDGAQNPSLAKDLTILAVDAGAGFGNGRVIPAGPLREPLETGLARAGLAVLIGPPGARAAARAAWPELAGLPLAEAELRPPHTGLDLGGMPVVAFAGIGRPAKFFETLAGLGAELRETHGFPDHHAYPEAVLRRLLRAARGQGAMLVTTEKDAVRLPERWRREVMALPVRLEPLDWAPLDAALAAVLPAPAGDRPGA